MTLYYLNSAPNPDDDRGKRTGDPLTPPRGAPFTGDVASLLIREAREGAAVEIEQLGVLLRSPNTAMGELAKQAAGKVTHPRFLLTKASWSARAGEPPPREAMIFGGAYPSGRESTKGHPKIAQFVCLRSQLKAFLMKPLGI